ncbi:hypothetical protein JXA84_01350 [candidate division WOR-3 bacterium]|nr:hypothetical protein [candidate division WOR-3 bacterium]
MSNYPYYTDVDQIYHCDWTAQKYLRFSLMKEVLGELFPQNHRSKFIQIAGTSGKGSVCRFLEAAFSVEYKTGAFVNPHLFDFRERFSVNGKIVDQNEILDIWENTLLPLSVKMLSKKRLALSYSEVCVLFALLIFQKHEVDWAFMETGCGGRYERLTALKAEAAVITSVGYDHPLSLGEEKWQRACDKAGIIRTGKPLFTAEPDDEIVRIFAQFCEKQNADLIRLKEKSVEEVRNFHLGEGKNFLIFNQEHQIKNAALALEIFRFFKGKGDIRKALKKMGEVVFLGRFEEIAPGVFIDIAHNEDKIHALFEHLQKNFFEKKIILVVALSNLRSPDKIFKNISSIAERIIVTRASYSSVEPEDIAKSLQLSSAVPVEIIENPREAYEKAVSLKTDNSIVVLTGSNYMIDQAINPDRHLSHLNLTYGWRYKH